MNVNENMMREESSLALSSIKVKDDDLLFFSSAANSPPSSAFVSALQSPYISPRAVPPPDLITIIKTKTESPSSSSSFSTEEEEELPSTSYTPPSDPYEFSDSTTPPPPRISFSFPTLPCPSSNNNNNSNSKLRSCDVFIGFCGQSAPAGLLRFCRWLKAHLELHGIACFLADRSSYSDSHSHDVADRLICSAAFGVVVVTPASASNRLSLEEIHFFSHKKNFVPVLFSFHPPPADPLLSSAFLASPDASDWRRCVASASAFLRARLAREPSPRAAEESESETDSEVPFPRNPGFRGREEELREMEDAVVAGKVRGKAVVCVSGAGGVGKTELALEFAHRHRQRYAAVVWVGGEGRHLRHNMLQLSVRLGVDVSSAERERGRVGFEEQEREALRRVKRELFRDIPYLIVIDNLDSSADPNDFLPPHHHNSAGITASHVIITTSVTSAVTFPVTVHLNPLRLPHSLSLLLSDSSSSSSLAALNHRLGGLPLAVVLARSLLSTLTPSALLQNLDNDESEEEDVSKLLSMCLSSAGQAAAGMADVAAWLASSPAPARLIWRRRKTHWWKKDESEEGAKELARLNLGRISKRRDGSTWIQLHPRAAEFVRKTRPGGAKEAVERVIAKAGGGGEHWDHLWASAFLVFGYKGQAPAVELAGDRMVRYVRTRALPLANAAFAQFSRCSSAVELLKVCSDALEDLEKSFVSQIQRTSSSSASSRLLCFACGEESVDECVWQHVTLLKATLLETRAKLLMRGGYFDAAEEVCRTCISIRTVMLGHAHPLTLAAHHTLAAIVRIRTNFL